MNKLKICPSLLKDVSILQNEIKGVIIYSNNFLKTKQFLRSNNYNFIPYRFASCFFVKTDYEDLKIFSNLDCVSYIYPNICVQTLANEKNIVKRGRFAENGWPYS